MNSNPDLRLIDPLEKLRRETLERIRNEEAKRQRLCLHKWFTLTRKLKVCTICQKVLME